jgi:nitrate/nitrite transporter NarK
MALHSGALWSAIHVTPGLSAYAFGAMLGAAGSMIRAVEGAARPRYFGVRHIGSIRGLVAAISVGGTACGPLLFATVFDHAASYDTALLACTIPPLAVAVWAFVAREPDTAVPLPAQTALSSSERHPISTHLRTESLD